MCTPRCINLAAHSLLSYSCTSQSCTTLTSGKHDGRSRTYGTPRSRRATKDDRREPHRGRSGCTGYAASPSIALDNQLTGCYFLPTTTTSQRKSQIPLVTLALHRIHQFSSPHTPPTPHQGYCQVHTTSSATYQPPHAAFPGSDDTGRPRSDFTTRCCP